MLLWLAYLVYIGLLLGSFMVKACFYFEVNFHCLSVLGSVGAGSIFTSYAAGDISEWLCLNPVMLKSCENRIKVFGIPCFHC